MRVTAEKLGKRFNREWILWGQLPPSSGSVKYELGSNEISGSEIFHHLSIATPYMELIDEFTLIEMVKFHFKFKKVRGDFSAEELIKRMELTHARHKNISNFSSGMRQRLKLALAFYSDSSLVFLDEPSTNLDKKALQWYTENLLILPKNSLIFIASNQEHEYPSNAIKMDITAFK
jgi:ABC-type multidrug transport system ATPase subunit